MTLSGLLYVGAIVLFIVTAVLLLVSDLEVRDALALIAIGLAALAAAGTAWTGSKLR